MECWGAAGGANPQGGSAGPGKGGYTSGTISLAANTNLYIVVGSVGQSSTKVANDAGGYNGGGAGGSNGVGRKNCSGGGGATDIRVIKGSTWQTLSSLRSRIMVAAGGAGCGGPFTDDTNSCIGGYAGGLTGGNGSCVSNYTYVTSAGATQTSPGTTTASNSTHIDNTHIGSFGYANQDGNDSYGSGGGGGWYGGSRGYGNGGSGGSSFISGHTGCNAINPSTGAHLGASTTMTINNVNYRFTSTSMKAGNASQTKPGGGTETGHSGNGYARITLTRY